LLSPASVSIAMSLAYRGAAGKTADEMARTLHFGFPPQDILRANRPLIESLALKAEGRELTATNAIWIDRSLLLKPAYRADVGDRAGASVRQVDFQQDSDAARVGINQWVETATHGRIRDLLAPPHVTPQTRSILVNTLYLKANWAQPFARTATKTGAFTGLDGRRVQTALMTLQWPRQAIERDGVKAIILSYRGEELEMVVLLPNSAKALPKLEAKLTVQLLDQWLARLATAPMRDTVLTLPRMKFGSKSDLVPTFKRMGMTAPFQYGADFAGIAAVQPPQSLAIGAIVHQSFFEANEEGSEAAAATAVTNIVVVSGTRRTRPPPPPIIFRADKPFLFLLRDRRTGLILFIGRYVAPDEASSD
jgi:serpin B